MWRFYVWFLCGVSMARPGRYEAAAYAARQALQCHGTPGSLRSFAQHTLGRAFEAQGDEARVERALDACRQHFGSAQAAYSAVSQIDEVVTHTHMRARARAHTQHPCARARNI